jgi:hypothetical protein
LTTSAAAVVPAASTLAADALSEAEPPGRTALSRGDVVLSLYNAETYAWAALSSQVCPGCSRELTLHPIANFYTNRLDATHVPTPVCDLCAKAVAPSLFLLLQRLRDVIPRSEYGIDVVLRVAVDELNQPFFATTYCSHCEELIHLENVPGIGEFHLCNKVTRAPLCDACAELLATRELLDVLKSYRRTEDTIA